MSAALPAVPPPLAANPAPPLPAASAAPASASAAPDTVVLLHGLGRTRLSLLHLARALAADGYRVVNLTYPSRTRPLEWLAATWLPAQLAAHVPAAALAAVPGPPDSAAASSDPAVAPPRLHFVTHSMGGILVRLWLRETGTPPHLGRVVMLAPPNAGSELPDRLAAWPAFRWATGLNGRRLGTGPASLPRALGPWPAPTSPLGIIAGTKPLPLLPAAWVPAPHDGKVSVASTHLAGESAHLSLPLSHTWLPWHRTAVAAVRTFLRTGAFAPAAPPAAVSALESHSLPAAPPAVPAP